MLLGGSSFWYPSESSWRRRLELLLLLRWRCLFFFPGEGVGETTMTEAGGSAMEEVLVEEKALNSENK